MKKKSLVVAFLALSMILTLFAGCGNATVPPENESVPSVESSEPELAPAPITVEGTVKSISLSKMVLTLADGTDLSIDISGVSGVKAQLGDTVKVEYIGDTASAVAEKIEVTVEAEKDEAPAETSDKSEIGEEKDKVPESDNATTSASSLMAPASTSGTPAVSAQSVASSDEDDTGSQSISNDSESKNTAPTTAKGSAKAIFESASGFEVYDWTTPATSFRFASYIKEGQFLSSDYTALGSIDINSLPDYAALMRGEMDGNTFMARTAELFNDYRGVSSSDSDASAGTPETPPSAVPSKDDKQDDTQPEHKPAEKEPEISDADTGDVYEAIRLINAERVKAGLSELEIDDDLMAAAAVRAREITDVYEHTRPDGRDFSTVFSEFGVSCSKYKENCIAGSVTATADAAVKLWMGSSAHKAAILNENVTRIGLGFYQASGANYKYGWTMLATN